MLEQQNKFNSAYNKAVNLFKGKKFKDAYQISLEAYSFAQTDNEKIAATYMVVDCSLRLNKFEEALEHLNEILKRKPTEAEKISSRIYDLIKLNKISDDVLALINNIIKLRNNYLNYKIRGDLYYARKEWGDALSDYETSLALKLEGDVLYKLIVIAYEANLKSYDDIIKFIEQYRGLPQQTQHNIELIEILKIQIKIYDKNKQYKSIIETVNNFLQLIPFPYKNDKFIYQQGIAAYASLNDNLNAILLAEKAQAVQEWYNKKASDDESKIKYHAYTCNELFQQKLPLMIAHNVPYALIYQNVLDNFKNQSKVTPLPLKQLTLFSIFQYSNLIANVLNRRHQLNPKLSVKIYNETSILQNAFRDGSLILREEDENEINNIINSLAPKLFETLKFINTDNELLLAAEENEKLKAENKAVKAENEELKKTNFNANDEIARLKQQIVKLQEKNNALESSKNAGLRLYSHVKRKVENNALEWSSIKQLKHSG